MRPGVDVDALRARVGMVFQQPVVFPCSVLENVVFGARHLQRASRGAAGRRSRRRALREAALWDEVKDRLREPAQAPCPWASSSACAWPAPWPWAPRSS